MNPPLAVNKYVKMESDIMYCFEKGFRENYESARHNL